jgi:hypothetical protein
MIEAVMRGGILDWRMAKLSAESDVAETGQL